MPRHIPSTVVLVVLTGALIAQDQAELIESGPKVGEMLPGPFDAYNVSGKNAKDRQHCLVCEFGLGPVVMVFARETADGKDGAITSLLQKLDAAVSRHTSDPPLRSFAVFLSPDAKNSAFGSAPDAKKIVEETLAREALVQRLKERADKLKNVVVAFYPAQGPPKYDIKPKAEVTVIFYKKHKVLANFAFPEGKMTEEDGNRIIEVVDKALGKM